VKNTVQIAGKRVSRVICTYLSLVARGLVDGRYLEVAGTTTPRERERERERERDAQRRKLEEKIIIKKNDTYVYSATPQRLMWRCTVHRFMKTLFWIQDR